MLPRYAERRLRSALREQPAAALLGPRQVGKTTLARALGGHYFDLELETERLRLDLEWEQLVRAKGLLVLDEACAACRTGLVDESLLQQAAALAGHGREVVFTGRNPAAWMLEQADYATEMRAEKHPYSKGVAAREGVEF